MNRKQRRAARVQSSAAPAAAEPSRLFAEAMLCQRQNRVDDAIRAYRRLLALQPDHAQARNNLACLLQTQGKLHEASDNFAAAVSLMPQALDDFAGVCATLTTVLPAIGLAMTRADAAWPERLSAEQLLDGGLTAIAEDPLLQCILQSAPVRNVALERTLTDLRAWLLGRTADESALNFACALAKQCFVNEYVFATTPEEDARVEELRAGIATAIETGGEIAPMLLAALATYGPLHALPRAEALLERRWPAALDDVVTQQLREPLQERELRAAIPRLTPIDDDVSQRVRAQYEENPYPRWIGIAGGVEPIAIDLYLRELFPTAGFLALGKTELLDILVAGCGTGWQATGLAQKFKGAQVLAVDLSLASLAYAKRKTPPALAARIAYAQADILRLGTLDRRFDVIDSSGVLHHMADPLEGWRILLGLLKPGGLMHLGLYSELARNDVVEARAFIAARGYLPTPTDIRRCRQDLLATPLRSLARANDFFSTSECRDFLFHVQESRMSIPAIKQFIAEQKLKFIGFEFGQAAQRHYRTMFAERGWSAGDLDRWHEVETQNPQIFSGMYHFWIQKT